MNVYLPNGRLPSAYQEVEYIQSSGTQYIVIGTSFKTSYKTVVDFQMTATGGDQVVVGIYKGGVTKRYGLDAWQSNFKVITGGSDWSNTISEDTNRHKFTINKSTVTVDGTNYSCSYSDYTYTTGLGVFTYLHDSQTEANSKNKLYKLDIYDENGIHIYDLVPCYRKSDNVIGLYDLVNNQFYTNAGTGTFSKGNDVTMSELKNAYIGEVLTKSIDVRGKTLAQIQAEGWSLNNWRGSYTLNSDGLTVSSSNSSCALYFTLPNTLTTNSKITVKATGYCTVPNSGSYGGLLFAGVGSTAGDGYYNNCIASEYSSGDNAYSGKTGITCNGSMVSSDGPRRVAGNISYELTVDLSTGACNMNLSGPTTYTGTATLTSTQISSILAYNKASAIIEEFTNGYTMRLQTISFTIEG